MCKDCKDCFSEEEELKLKDLGWTKEQIEFADSSVVEDKIRELI